MWATVWYNKTGETISQDLPYLVPITVNGSTALPSSVTIGSATFALTQGSTNDLILQSGDSMVVYILNPDHISVNDIGVTVGITVFTANAQYYKESNVEASS